MSENNDTSWELSFGFYKGIVIGMRTYEAEDGNTHVLYIPFIDIALKIYNHEE
jgi:hypothetical protein